MSNYKMVKVVFGVDKRAAGSYRTYYGSNPNASKSYDYWVEDAEKVAVGDLAVVSTPTHGLTVVTVIEVREVADVNKGYYKPIVGVVQASTWQAREERAKKAKELEAKLAKMAHAKKTQLDLKTLLGDDPEAMKMMEELKELHKDL